MALRRLMQVTIMLSGFIAWAVQFTLVYGLTSTLCAREWASARLLGFNLVPAAVFLTTLAAFLGTAGILAWSIGSYRHMRAGKTPDNDMFMASATILISGLSMVAIIWNGLPAILLPSCA